MHVPTYIQMICSIVFFLVGLLVFIAGFIPVTVFDLNFGKNYLQDDCFENFDNETCQALRENMYPKQYDKVVLILIDALRADFVPTVMKSDFNVSLPFTESLLHKNEAISFINKVFSPTVTLPRIKTLVTGKSSNIIDMINNFNAKKLMDDNFLYQAKLKGLKTIFYGDETWLKVFPNFFLRSEGTHSFFVRDFTEVDNNVTRHLKGEFTKTDWDIMVLHYLGVDHIGHGYGPHSSHLAPKLLEMDSVIQLIYNNLKNNWKKKSLIIVCGDHGMTSEGNHGGVSKSETLTPLIFINTQNSKYNSNEKNKLVSQLDIAATLSILLGLPIPASNTGTVLLDVLNYTELQPRDMLNALLHNILQLCMSQKVKSTNKELFKSILDIIDIHIRGPNVIDEKTSVPNFSILLDMYSKVLRKLKDSQSPDKMYDNISFIKGLALMWQSLLWLSVCFLTIENDELMCQALHFCAKGMLNKFSVSLLIACTILSLCVNMIFYTICFIALMCMSIINTIVWLVKYIYARFSLKFIEKYCIVLFVLQCLSLFSSSYVEKEHDVWYFAIITVIILLIIRACKLTIKLYSMDVQVNKRNVKSFFGTFINKGRFYQLDILVILLIFHYLIRDYGLNNDEGIIRENFLRLKELFVRHSILLLLTQIVIVFIFFFRQKNRFAFYLFSSGLLLIQAYQTQNTILLMFLKAVRLNIIVIPWIIYLLIGIIVCTSIFLVSEHSPVYYEKNLMIVIDITSAWILLTQLIGQTHLLPLTAFILVQEIFLNKITWKNKIGMILNVTLYLQMAFYFFYCQGNTNNLSTIDVSSGYVGLLSFNRTLVGFLIICNTYNSLVLWLMLLYFRILKFFHHSKSLHILDITYLFIAVIIYRFFMLAVYCIVMFLMKHHLFIMSVFAPKLFYELTHTFIFMVCAIFFSAFQLLSNQ